MSTFEELASTSVAHLRSIEDTRALVDSKILETEAKVLKVNNLIRDEFIKRQQENATIRGTILQLKIRADEVVAQVDGLRTSHSEDKEFQENVLRDQIHRLIVSEEYYNKQRSLQSTLYFQRTLAEVQERFSSTQRESAAKVQMIKDEMLRNDGQLVASTQTLAELKTKLESATPEVPRIDRQIAEALTRNAAYEKRVGQLRSTIEEIEKSEEDAKDRQRMEKEKEMPEKPPKSPIPARRGVLRERSGSFTHLSLDRGRSNSVSNLSYDVYKREAMASLNSPTTSPKPSPKLSPHLSPHQSHSPMPSSPLGSSPLSSPPGMGALQLDPDDDPFADLINEIVPKLNVKPTDEPNKLPAMLELKVLLPSKESVVVTWNHFTDNVNTVKKNVHQILVGRQLWPIGESRVVEDCVFKTAADNFLLDEKSTPYLVYCLRKKISPVLYLVERKLHKDFLDQLGTILGDVPIAEGGQANYFRDQMVGLLEEIGRVGKEKLNEMWKNRVEQTQADLDMDVIRRRGSVFGPTNNMVISRIARSENYRFSAEIKFSPVSPTSPPSERDFAMDARGEVAGPTCSIRLYLSAEINKIFTCERSASIGDVQNIIYAKYLKDLSFIQKVDDISFGDYKSKFVLKPQGRDDFLLMQNLKLTDIEYISQLIRRQKTISLILVDISKQGSEEFDSYMESYTNSQGEVGPEEFEDFGRPTEGPEFIPIWKVSKPLRVKVGGVKNMPQIADGDKVYVTIGLYQQGEIFSATSQTKQIVLTTNPTWLVWLDILAYNNIPWGAIMHIRVFVTNPKTKNVGDTMIAWVNHRLLDYKDCINSGFFSVKMWQCASVKENPAAIPQQNEDPAAPVLTFEIEMARPVPFFSDMTTPDFVALGLNVPPSLEERDSDRGIVDRVIATDPLYKPTPEQLAILWRNRYYCRQKPKSVAKLLQAVPWKDSACVYEIYSMLDSWAPLTPTESLELFNPKFIDRQIRRFAIKNLKRMGDLELSNYLLQMVQALKHETNHDSPLAHFLLRRALMNRLQIGQPFFWQLKAELQKGAKQTEWGERFALVLEAFLRGCGSALRDDFFGQYDVYMNLKSAALAIKPLAAEKRREALKAQLALVKIPNNGFPLPTNASLRGKAFDLDKVKSMQSKTMPLWLVFSNMDPFGDPVLSMFKAGDDLRQDQLTLQMIRIMDKMWYDAGLDLQTTFYRCVSTGPDEGWIEIVTEAVTIADIQKSYGGFSAAFSESAIANWLREKNTADWEYTAAVENFIHSCASSCVATYLLGIGDRHNDNIMIQKSGHLFHIDFGRFLGNYQTWNGIKYVMGGADHPNFKRFVDLCGKAYNILRKNAHIFLNLFMMMVGTGLPELTCQEDINYLRDAFKLDSNDERAAEKFAAKITKSMNSKATELNFAVHIMANPN